MSLCSWSITCLNTPGARETKFTVLWRKCALAGLGIVLPEIITVTAVGQWVRARQCVADFNDLEKEQSKTEEQGSTAGTIEKPSSETTSKSKEQWTLDMAFFADMGGFRLRTKNGASFPLDAQQLLYLVRKGYVKQPIFKPRLIDDKNKVDFLLRTIILCQILWFLVGIIGRWAQNLFVTTWEITVVSFVLCSAVTFGFWWYKPADVVLAEFIDIDLDADDILKQEGREGTPWKFTPLDFVSRKEWWWSKAWWAYLNFLHAWHFRFGSDHFRFGSKGEPVDRIADTLQRPLGPKEVYGCLVLATACFSVFFIAWNHDFPTHVEMIFWRTASVAFMSIAYSTLFICELLRILHKMQPGTPSWGLRNTPSLPLQVDRSKKRRFSDSRVIQWIVNGVNKALDKIRNNSPDQDPTLALPLRVMGPLYVIATSYVLFRGYILIQDVIELRQLPASAYKSVEWSNYWPHLG
ncbi:MAG: hypothetical protein L6R41_006275 [Letrouitia leprolyta]|nr:MAG: hypothetical protein L6R41_006275 [Letrouitia leprolyta]